MTSLGMEALSVAIRQNDTQIQKLDFGRNEFGDDGAIHVAKCITYVEQLGLIGCNIGAKGVKLLSQGIMQRDYPLTRLDLCQNKFEDDGAEHLKFCLHKINKLYVRGCGISPDVARSLQNYSAEFEVIFQWWP